MNRRWKGAAALALTLTLITPAARAAVVADGVALTAQEAWVEEGTSYITLRSYADRTGRELSWDGSSARLTGSGLELKATPGRIYVLVNGRAIYVEDGVPVKQGELVLPLRVVAQATGAELTWDGATGTASLNHRSAQPQQAAYNEEDLYWLSRVISAESRGEPLVGQIAVGNVVLNRVKDGQFPNTIKEVVFDRKHAVQFEPVSNGTIYDEPTESAVLAAKLCLEGANVVGDCTYFFAPALSAGHWIVNNRTYHSTIGCHQFYL